ncbi:BaiN/RdsA family NAD(P)/FAD-dependent oxidoreductase [Vallitalea okinawensis]|uniref:NAD(P)/FAD-dependent oxidoreductase n=1 Tax=Vallitalea okinawensis TaxID=2078660 RepID=UPI000CFDF327|nr:NAD(P)/FAD-dependent oxidoreductase [Vallitalea okinawensis]
MKKVIVIGGGPAGMIAAGVSASNGNSVILIEKNERLGRKLAITGKGRCNITNASDIDTILSNIITNKKFMYTSLYTFTNEQVIEFFEERGVKTKVERGNRVFPCSDDAKEVVNSLEKYLRKNKVKVLKGCTVKKLIINDQVVTGVQTTDGQTIEADAIIVATGGKSYPGTGSTGDGYQFAKTLGIDVKPIKPALVPLNAKESWVKELQGLSLRNVKVAIKNNHKIIYEDFGEMLFTHFGVSGPLILSASSTLIDQLKQPLQMIIDLKPALDDSALDKRIIRDFGKYINKDFSNSLVDLLPRKLIPVIIERSGIDPAKKVNTITKEERLKLLALIKSFDLTITGARSIKEAIITSGGINVKEVDPHSMESKKIKGLYFAGEVLDVDALTGGYNLQIAFSTGYLAGISI